MRAQTDTHSHTYGWDPWVYVSRRSRGPLGAVNRGRTPHQHTNTGFNEVATVRIKLLKVFRMGPLVVLAVR